MKTIIKIPVYLEISSGQDDRKIVTGVVRDTIQPEIFNFLKERFDLSWISSTQRRRIKTELGDNATIRFVTPGMILKTGTFPESPSNKKPWDL